MNTEQVINDCQIEGNVIKLPNVQLDRKVYQEVAKRLQLIGGKWKGGKVSGFVFNEDPTDYLAQLQNGEKRNLKKEFQFFATPDALADSLVTFAGITPDCRIMEPSAGQGSIIKAINRVYPEMFVECCELMPLNRTFLKNMPKAILVDDDFLQFDEFDAFDIIIANPPFTKNQDIDHVLHMYKVIKPAGRIVTIMSNHWQLSVNRKETEFRKFLISVDAEVIPVDAGVFSESGTSIATSIVIINKP